MQQSLEGNGHKESSCFLLRCVKSCTVRKINKCQYEQIWNDFSPYLIGSSDLAFQFFPSFSTSGWLWLQDIGPPALVDSETVLLSCSAK